MNDLKQLILEDLSRKYSKDIIEKLEAFTVEQLIKMHYTDQKNIGHYIERFKNYKVEVNSISGSNFSSTVNRTIKHYENLALLIKEQDKRYSLNPFRTYDYQSYRDISIEQYLTGELMISDSNNHSYEIYNFTVNHETKTVHIEYKHWMTD